MHVQTVLVDTSWLHNIWQMFYFLLNSSCSGKTAFLRKLKLIYPSTPSITTMVQPPPLIFFKKLLAPLPFKKEKRDYAFYMRD